MSISTQLEDFLNGLVPTISQILADANILVCLVYLFTIIVFALVILLRKRIDDNKPEKTLELMAIIVGSSVGVCVGFFIGAVGPEGHKYVAVGGAIWGFIAGYVLSKLEPLFGIIVDDVKALNATENKGDLYIKTSMFLCCFMFTLVMTLNVKAANAARYLEGNKKAPQSQSEVQKDHAPAPQEAPPAPQPN
jgi:hypothetical protein